MKGKDKVKIPIQGNRYKESIREINSTHWEQLATCICFNIYLVFTAALTDVVITLIDKCHWTTLTPAGNFVQ